MSVVVEGPDKSYALLVDGVGEVLSRPAARSWPARGISMRAGIACRPGIIQLDQDLLVILDLPALFAPALQDAA